MSTITKTLKRRNFLKTIAMAPLASLWVPLWVHKLFGATGMEKVEPTTRIFQEGNQKLIVYSDVPGATPSEFYKIRVRSEASKGKWQPVFAHVTRSLYSQAKIPTRVGVMENYQEHTKDWSYTYGNIEMAGPVEVEISRANGVPIKKATTHPIVRAGLATVKDGKAYFTLNKPAPITVDIDGQMDDQHTGAGYEGPPIHTVGIFAHPIFEKPSPTGPGVVVVRPGTKPPANPSAYSTLYFSAGVHDLGRDIKVYENKQYYIAGDAIVYGTFNNLGVGGGKNIKIFGLGTISGDHLKHSRYDPDYLQAQKNGAALSDRDWRSICIEGANNVAVEGVCVANPANHAFNLATGAGKDASKVTFIKWAKVISWRANGDGVGSARVVEDCFLRTADDSAYIKGDRRRCVFWKDCHAAVFHMAGIPSNFPIVIEDCDVLYLRDKEKNSPGGGVFVERGEGVPGNHKINVLVRDFRIEDRFPTNSVFVMYSKGDAVIGKSKTVKSGAVGSSYSGITFQNITAAASSVVGKRDILRGCKEAPWSNIVFDNVVIAGKKYTSLNDFAYVNEYVTDITFK